MFGRFLYLSASLLVLLCTALTPGQVFAQRMRGMPTMRVTPQMGGMTMGADMGRIGADRRFLDPSMNGSSPFSDRRLEEGRFNPRSPFFNPLLMNPLVNPLSPTFNRGSFNPLLSPLAPRFDERLMDRRFGGF